MFKNFDDEYDKYEKDNMKRAMKPSLYEAAVWGAMFERANTCMHLTAFGVGLLSLLAGVIIGWLVFVR